MPILKQGNLNEFGGKSKLNSNIKHGKKVFDFFWGDTKALDIIVSRMHKNK